MDKHRTISDELFECMKPGSLFEQMERLAKLEQRAMAGEFKKEHANDNAEQ